MNVVERNCAETYYEYEFGYSTRRAALYGRSITDHALEYIQEYLMGVGPPTAPGHTRSGPNSSINTVHVLWAGIMRYKVHTSTVSYIVNFPKVTNRMYWAS